MTASAAARRLLLAAAVLLVVPMLLAAHCQKPKPVDVADLSITAAAEAYTRWFTNEIDRAMLLDPGAKSARLDALASVNRRWNAAEDLFDLAMQSWRAGKAKASDVEAAHTAALRLICELGVYCGGGG